MKFIWDFQSSTDSYHQEYNMEIIDEYTIEISGLRMSYNTPAIITIVDAQKLKVVFLDDEKNTSDTYLIKSNDNSEEVYNNSNSNDYNDYLNNSLSTDEERLLKYLKNSISTFKNPASVRVVTVYSYDKSEDVFYVDISAENSLGGNTLELYEVSDNKIYKSMTSRDTFEYITMAPGDPCSCDVGTINDLLEEYYDEMGWN